MKIAILTYGEYRTAKHAVQSWNILNTEHEIDVYVHTQNKSDDTPISEKNIRDLFPRVSQCKIWLEERDAFKFDEEPRDLHLNFRSYRFLYKKLKEHLESSNTTYDFIIVNRLDTTLFIKNINDFLLKSLKEELKIKPYEGLMIVKNDDHVKAFNEPIPEGFVAWLIVDKRIPRMTGYFLGYKLR